MTHHISHLHIPYTIKRNKNYYLNFKLRGKVHRHYLHTQDSFKAMWNITSIINILTLDKVDYIVLKELVAAVNGNIENNTKALLFPGSDEAKQSLNQYQEDHGDNNIVLFMY